VEDEERPYRRVTFEWYRNLETGTFLLKTIMEGEGVKEGRRETTFTLSADAIDMTEPINIVDIFNDDENIDESLLSNRTAVALAKLLAMVGGNNIDALDALIDASINILDINAREITALDAIKLKMALSGKKS